MGKQNEIIISGVGGQGLILCGTLMAQAAVLHDTDRLHFHPSTVWKPGGPLQSQMSLSVTRRYIFPM